MLKGSDAAFRLMSLVDDAEGRVEVAGKGREGVEPRRAREVTSLVKVGLDELKGRSSKVADRIEHLRVLIGEPRWLGLEVDPAVAEEGTAVAGLGAVEGRGCRGLGFGRPRCRRLGKGRHGGSDPCGGGSGRRFGLVGGSSGLRGLQGGNLSLKLLHNLLLVLDVGRQVGVVVG